MFYVYILRSETGLYIGYTSDLQHRLREHNTNKNKSTKNKGPWEIVYYEAHLSSEDARRREGYFKTSAGKTSLKRMLRTTLTDG